MKYFDDQDNRTVKALLYEAIEKIEAADSLLVDTEYDKYTNASLLTAEAVLKDIIKMLDEEIKKHYF